MNIKIYKIDKNQQLPSYGTNKSCCFDIRCSFHNIRCYKNNKGNRCITIEPKETILIGSGLIFDLPEGYCMKIHPRSGNALKKGLTFLNCEGQIDEDYTNELQFILYNASNFPIEIEEYDRIAQGEIVKYYQHSFTETNEEIQPKEDRTGGFGHTGVK